MSVGFGGIDAGGSIGDSNMGGGGDFCGLDFDDTLQDPGGVPAGAGGSSVPDEDTGKGETEKED